MMYPSLVVNVNVLITRYWSDPTPKSTVAYSYTNTCETVYLVPSESADKSQKTKCTKLSDNHS